MLNEAYAPEFNHLLQPERLTQNDIRFFLARREGAAVGCVALRVDPGGYGEVKRMYVAPTLRGSGLGRALLERVEAEARACGLTALRLETGAKQDAALALFEQVGFKAGRPFSDYEDNGVSLFMEKRL